MTLGWWAFAAIVCFANWVEALAGFGSTLFAVILGVYFFPLDVLIPALLPINLVLSTVIVSRHRRWIDWPTLLKRILPWAGSGTLAGIAIFQFVPQRELKILFGVVVAGLSIYELRRSFSRKTAGKRLGFWSGSLWLLGGGVMQGIYASGGPMVVYFSSRVLPDKNVFRSTLSMLWLLLTLVMLSGAVYAGRFGAEAAKLSAWMIVPLAIGIVLGELAHRHVPEKRFRQLVHALLLVAGLSLVGSSL